MYKKKRLTNVLKIFYKANKGFTLIEILVVISVISLLSSISMYNLQRARMRARDARRIADFYQLGTGLQLYYSDKGRMPLSYNCYLDGSPGVGFFNADPSACDGGVGAYGACDAAVPEALGGSTTNLVPEAFTASMQELVNAQIISRVPHSPGGPGYCYFDFGAGTGAVLMTSLESHPPSTTGIPPSCRPFAGAGNQWCDQTNNNIYCICVKY